MQERSRSSKKKKEVPLKTSCHAQEMTRNGLEKIFPCFKFSWSDFTTGTKSHCKCHKRVCTDDCNNDD